MKALFISILSFGVLSATTPNHAWMGALRECANFELEKQLEHNPSKEELESILDFECSYSGEIEFEAIQDLVNVEDLDMRGNRFVHAVIPPWIGDLNSLENLRLSGNDLSGAIPAEIGNLTNLKTLDLSANKLTKLPLSIGNLSSLEELHLSSNRIVQLLPAELGSLSNLTKLYLQDNRFFGEIPPELRDMLFLKKLRLNQNNLKGEIPSELMDIDLTQPNGLGLHENCALHTDNVDMQSWINTKASLYRGYDGVDQTGGNCWTPAMTPLLWYLLN